MPLDLVKVAAVLDAAADHFDAVEHEKTSTVNAERKAQIDILSSKYAESTGEEMPDQIRQKLATSDKDVIELLKTMFEKQAGRVESLGAPADKDDSKEAHSVKEAAENASDRFLSWICS